MLAACAPPPVDNGQPIIYVKSHLIPPAKTVDIDGAEYLQSRYPAGQFGGTFYTASIGQGPKTFNPLDAMDATSGDIAGLMFVGLTQTDPYTGKTIPYLAKSITIKPDKMTYIVKLRKGLVWSDNRPIIADDVVFTWQDIIGKGLGNKSNLDVNTIDGKFPTVKKIDNLTVEFKTPKPFAPFEGNLGTAILPKHIIEPVIKNNPNAFDSFWGVTASPKSFVVNGPFLISEYISSQRVILKRNPHFFMVDHQGRHLPYLDRYVIDFVQDLNAQILAFEQGHLDTIGVPGNQVYYVKHLKAPHFNLYDLGPSSGTTFIAFNLNPRKNKSGKPYVDPKTSRWFRDLNFRKAVDYAIHRNQIVQNILMGVGKPLFTAEGLSSIYLNKKLAEGHPYNLQEAKAYLKKSRFYWDSQGQLHDKDGNRVEFEMITNSGNTERESVGVALKDDLKILGMKVDFKPIDFNVLVGEMDSSAWESVILGLTGSPIEPNGGKNVWESDAALHLFNQRHPSEDMPGTDIMEPWEKQLDQLFDEGATTIDPQKRHQIYAEYQQVVYDNLPLIYLYSPNTIVAVRKRIQNVDPTPLGGTFPNIESIWVK